MVVPMSRIARGMIAAVLATVSLTGAGAQPTNASNATLKAAFIFNFAKFTEWPALDPGGAISLCVVGNDAIAAALFETVKGQRIDGHALDSVRPKDLAAWAGCHLLFIAEPEIRKSAAALNDLRPLPVLTVSDSKNFARSGGIIELYVEGDRMAFAINVTAAERSGLKMSSRLLGLARIVRLSLAP
jgi:hypothetical protein